MAGYFQERATVSFNNGSTAYVNGTFHVDLPFRAGYLSQITVIDTGTNGSNRAIYLFEDQPTSTTYYSTEQNENRIYTNGTFSSNAVNVRNEWRYFAAKGTADSTSGKVGRIFGCVYSNGSNGTNGTAMAYTIVLGGFGIN